MYTVNLSKSSRKSQLRVKLMSSLMQLVQLQETLMIAIRNTNHLKQNVQSNRKMVKKMNKLIKEVLVKNWKRIKMVKTQELQRKRIQHQEQLQHSLSKELTLCHLIDDLCLHRRWLPSKGLLIRLQQSKSSQRRGIQIDHLRFAWISITAWQQNPNSPINRVEIPPEE